METYTFLRYEFGCKIKPKAIILHNASTIKTPKKYGSASSSSMASGVRSSDGRCSSMAITKHVAMMVNSTVNSNGGHSIMNLKNRRIGFVSLNMNNDDGPGVWSASAFFPFFPVTTFTFTFWPEFVVVAVICVSTLAPPCASWTAALWYVRYVEEGKKCEQCG